MRAMSRLFLYFDADQWGERLMTLGKGTEVVVVGRIAVVNRAWVELRHCEFDDMPATQAVL
jgi:hypothetical protein